MVDPGARASSLTPSSRLFSPHWGPVTYTKSVLYWAQPGDCKQEILHQVSPSHDSEPFCSPNVWFPTPSGSGCPITSVTSDTVSLEITSDPTGQGLTPARLPPSRLRCQSQVQVATCVSDPLAIDWRFLQLPPYIWLIC